MPDSEGPTAVENEREQIPIVSRLRFEDDRFIYENPPRETTHPFWITFAPAWTEAFNEELELFIQSAANLASKPFLRNSLEKVILRIVSSTGEEVQRKLRAAFNEASDEPEHDEPYQGIPQEYLREFLIDNLPPEELKQHLSSPDPKTKDKAVARINLCGRLFLQALFYYLVPPDNREKGKTQWKTVKLTRGAGRQGRSRKEPIQWPDRDAHAKALQTHADTAGGGRRSSVQEQRLTQAVLRQIGEQKTVQGN